jgi:hypothetical protein
VTQTKTERLKQSQEALNEGNKRRIRMAKLRSRVREGKLPFTKALYHKDAQRIRLERLLRDQPKWGPMRVLKLMMRLDFPPGKQHIRIEGLLADEKKLIVKGVEDPNFWVM